jgi:hypothetical protein
MSAWVLVLVVMATSMSNTYPFDKDSNPTMVGIEVNSVTHAPSVVTIDFGDEAVCETAAKKLRDEDRFGTTKATCIARQNHG